MMSRDPLIFYPNKAKYLSLFILSALFVVGGVFLIKDGDRDPKIWGAVAFFGLCCIAFLSILIGKRYYLALSEEGFELKGGFNTVFTRWDEVSQFEVRKVRTMKIVTFNYTQKHKKYQMWKVVSKAMAGVEGGIVMSFKISPKDLAKLLNEWRERFLMDQQKSV